tara:strand:+ start:212 stop:361 length:150 start_codon:yes stop_codon:yes gene_type:complete
MEYLIAWNLVNTLGIAWLAIKFSQEKKERHDSSVELEKLIKKSLPKTRR